MPRYQDDFGGITGNPGRGRGMDPNHREGYQGMRMHATHGQSAYGWHRWTHPLDFESSGGFIGRYAGDYHDRPRRISPQAGREFDTRGGGGVYDMVREPEHLRMYNAESIRFRDEGRGARGGAGRYANDYRGAGLPRGRSGYDNRFLRGYTNRGRNEAGYTESWTWGPMRGAR